MITFTCDKCEKLLEVDDDLRGQKVECPYCGDVNVVKAASATHGAGGASGRPQARASAGPSSSKPSDPPIDKASQMGLPPDTGPGGPEHDVLRVHPAMFRARPGRGTLILLLIAGGVALMVFGGPATAGIGIFAGGVIVAAGLLWLLVWWIQCRTVTLILTNKRVTLRRGILARHTNEVLHDRIQDIQITQTLLQRFWKIGRIGISSSGEAGVEIMASDLPDPIRLREVIDAYRNV